MKRLIACCAACLLLGVQAADRISLEGEYDGHLQDVWMTSDAIWWAHTECLVKTDRNGKVIRRAEVGGHHAGLEVKDGRLYTAVCAFNGEPRGATTPKCHVMVGEYDAETLERIEMHVLDINDRAGSFCFLEDGTFLVGCLRHPSLKPSEVKFHHIGKDWKLIKTHVVDVGRPVKLGIEVIRRYGNDLYLFIYGCPVIRLDAHTFEKTGGLESAGGQTGFAKEGDSVWVGTTSRPKEKDAKTYRSGLARIPWANFAPVGGDTLKVTGTGDDDTHVRMEAQAVEPSTVYAVTCRMRHPEGKDTGVAVLVADGVSMYKRPVGNGWMAFTNVFMTAAGTKSVACDLRQWHIPGVFEFADIRFEKVTPRYRTVDGLQLGFGESVDGRAYHYGTTFSSDSHTQSRPLVAVRSASFGNGCVSFGGKTSLEFVHELPGRDFRAGRVGLLCDRISSGAVTVALSADGQTWTDALTVTNAGFHAADVPAALLPSAKVHARVFAASGTSAAIRNYSFDAKLKGAMVFGFGATEYVDASGRTLHVQKPWDYLSDATSGERLPGGSGGITCWRQSSGRKVFKGRPVPTATAKALRLATARNEEEAVQLVIRPSEDLANVRVTAELEGDFAVEVRRVGYLDIGFLADGMGARGSWPDPIFAQDPDGCAIAADENQPFWVSVKPGKGATAGVHRGSVSVACSKGTFRVPLEVRVFGFDFPDRVSCESAFGLSWKTVFAYQHLKTPEEKREVVEKYLAHFARHHISPYAPMPMLADPSYTMKWTKTEREEDSVPVIDWTEWDVEIDRVLAKYAFTTFKFHLRGIGFGDMTGAKGVRSLNGAKAGTELFEIYLSRYLKAVESHLKEKGLLNRAYIYVFDEPLPQYFAYANENLARIRKYAPGLRRMVTVEPREEFVGGVNLWCPITESFDREKSAAAQARGEEVWWYITFSSLQPKVNEHVEHAGVDMRVWLWQTWLEKVTGVLIWEAVHWNAQRIYPDPEHPQNPYEDTVCWGGSHPWNSGEGRYVFPPPRCFETKDPVLEGPVDSIRFEMLREGIEDYEYFAMLKKLDPANPLLRVPADVTTSLDDYSTDPAAMETHRLRLAKALEAAQ